MAPVLRYHRCPGVSTNNSENSIAQILQVRISFISEHIYKPHDMARVNRYY